MTAFQSIRLSAQGAPETPNGGSDESRLKSRMRRRRQAVDCGRVSSRQGVKGEEEGLRVPCVFGWWLLTMIRLSLRTCNKPRLRPFSSINPSPLDVDTTAFRKPPPTPTPTDDTPLGSILRKTIDVSLPSSLSCPYSSPPLRLSPGDRADASGEIHDPLSRSS